MGVVMKKGDTVLLAHVGYYRVDEPPNTHGMFSAAPLGGGFVGRFNEVRVLAVNPALPPWKRAVVGFDEAPFGVAFVRDGDRWNGWMKPMLQEKDLARAVELLNDGGDGTVHYALGGSREVGWVIRWNYIDSAEAEDSGEIESSEIDVDGVKVKAWDFGNLGLAWITYPDSKLHVQNDDFPAEEWDTTLIECFEREPDTPWGDDVARLQVGKETTMGGGAAPSFTVRRVE
jgi:hypothetical protein